MKNLRLNSRTYELKVTDPDTNFVWVTLTIHCRRPIVTAGERILP
ncbi:hypothetical protein QO004_003877 [Rhizobium mesoamericanum]|nr:hypothetical protein [Rhizobium mesoamericanum]